MSNLVHLDGFHTALPVPTLGDSDHFLCSELTPHPWLDLQKLQNSIQKIPPDVSVGREIYLENVPGFEATPWGLIVTLEAATSIKVRNHINISYDPVIGVLPRKGYGDFFAGELTPESGTLHLGLSTVLDSWPASVNGEDVRKYMTNECGLITPRNRLRRNYRLANQKLGLNCRIPGRGDVPAALTGLTMIPPIQEGLWKPMLMGMYQVPGYEEPALYPMADLKPVRSMSGQPATKAMFAARA